MRDWFLALGDRVARLQPGLFPYGYWRAPGASGGQSALEALCRGCCLEAMTNRRNNKPRPEQIDSGPDFLARTEP